MEAPELPVITPGDIVAAGRIVDLGIISLLVDKGILSPDELTVRIEQVQQAGGAADRPGVLFLLHAMLEELRDRPGAKA